MKKISDIVSTNLSTSLWRCIEKNLVLLVLACASVLLPFGEIGKSFAQQMPFSSQYYTNPLVVNPAYTGINKNVNFFLTHRSQWTGLAGAPQTSFFTIDGPIRAKNSSLGLKIYSDVTDIVSRAGVFVNYAYNFKISDSNNLYFGVAAGVMNNKIDFSKAMVPDADDPFIYQQSQNKTLFSADLGIVYIRKKLTVGFAVPQLLGNRIKYPVLNGDNSFYTLNRHYQGTIKYLFDVSKEKGITAYPLVMIRGVKGAPLQYDINAIIDWKRTGWVGVTYHSNHAIAISAGIRYHNFSVGYAYDIGISNVKSYTGSSSEFLLGYTFMQKKKELDRFVNVEEQRIDISALGGNENSDTNRVLINKMRADADMNQSLLARSKAVADSNQAEINRLKSELEKAKTPAITKTNDKEADEFNLALAAKLKAIADANQAEIDRLKSELEKSKAVTETKVDAIKPTAFVTIRLLDEDGNMISDAHIEVIDKSTNKVISTPEFDKEGYSRIPVPTGKTVDIVVTKSGYLFKTFNVVVPDSVGYEKKIDDITLQKVGVGKKIVLNNISFELNKATMRKESISDLKHAAKLMKDIPSLEIEISGHTDNLGPVEFNKELSRKRAKVVMDQLINMGVDKNRLTYKGYGSTQPFVSNETREGREANRRTEFKVLKVDSGYNIVPEKSPSKVEELPKTSTPEKKIQPVPQKKKKAYKSKGSRGNNRVTIGGKN